MQTTLGPLFGLQQALYLMCHCIMFSVNVNRWSVNLQEIPTFLQILLLFLHVLICLEPLWLSRVSTWNNVISYLNNGNITQLGTSNQWFSILGAHLSQLSTFFFFLMVHTKAIKSGSLGEWIQASVFLKAPHIIPVCVPRWEPLYSI